MSNPAWVDVGAGPVAVLLHAFPCDHAMWRAQVEPLVDSGWRVIVPDLPGFGRSDLPVDPPSLESVVQILADALLASSIDRCVLIGLSVGGYVIMEWLRRHPEMVAAVVLCDTKASADTEQARIARLDMADTIEADPSICPALLRERLLPVIIGPSAASTSPQIVATVGAWMDAADPASVAWYQRAMAARPDSLGTLRECGLPALVVWGVEDSMAPRVEQEIMVEALQDARLEVIPRAGHLSAVENPEEVSRTLVDFLTAVRRSTVDG